MNKQDECHVEEFVKPFNREALADAMAAYLTVWGMGCSRCALRVHNNLLRLDGVLLVEVVLEHCTAVVAYDPQRVGADRLVQAVSDAGDDGRHHYQAQVTRQMPAAEALRLT